MEVATTTANTPAVNRTPEQCGVHCRYQRALRDAQPLRFAVDVDTPDDICHWIEEWSWNPIGMPRAICEEDQGHLNEDDLDIWLWYGTTEASYQKPTMASLRGLSGMKSS